MNSVAVGDTAVSVVPAVPVVPTAMDIHFRIRAYLRQHGATNMGKYHLGWANGQTTVGRWDYESIPMPSAELLAAVPQEHLNYETSTVHTCDIFAGEIANPLPARAGTAWWPVDLTAARIPYVSLLSPSTTDRISLGAGFWKLTVIALSSENATCRVTVNEGAQEVTLHDVSMPAGQYVDFTRAICLANPNTLIRLKAKRQDNGATLVFTTTLLVEKL